MAKIGRLHANDQVENYAILEISWLNFKKKFYWEFPLWLRGNKPDWYPVRMQVQSLASLSGLRIQPSLELWCRLQMRLGFQVAVAVV